MHETTRTISELIRHVVDAGWGSTLRFVVAIAPVVVTIALLKSCA